MPPGGTSSFNWGYRGRRDRGQGRGRDRGRGRGRGGSRGGGPGGDARDGSRESDAGNSTKTTSGITMMGSRQEIQNLLSSIPEDQEMQVSFTICDSDNSPSPPSNKITRNEEDHPDPKPKQQKKDLKDPKDSKVIDPKLGGNCSAQNHKAAFCVNDRLNTEDWKSDEKSEGYNKLVRGVLPDMVALQRIYFQRPWHSKIRLPIEADNEKGEEFYHSNVMIWIA